MSSRCPSLVVTNLHGDERLPTVTIDGGAYVLDADLERHLELVTDPPAAQRSAPPASPVMSSASTTPPSSSVSASASCADCALATAMSFKARTRARRGCRRRSAARGAVGWSGVAISPHSPLHGVRRWPVLLSVELSLHRRMVRDGVAADARPRRDLLELGAQLHQRLWLDRLVGMSADDVVRQRANALRRAVSPRSLNDSGMCRSWSSVSHRRMRSRRSAGSG